MTFDEWFANSELGWRDKEAARAAFAAGRDAGMLEAEEVARASSTQCGATLCLHETCMTTREVADAIAKARARKP